jgi:5-methylcytosine-specific restriction endonuclease McrA
MGEVRPKEDAPFFVGKAMSTPAAKAIYNTREWRRTRLEVLDRDNHRCRYCGKPARTVHHRPRLEELLRAGMSPFDHAYLFSACHHCHGIEDGILLQPTPPAKVNRFKSWL